MLKLPLLHPEILRALAAAGHGARVLIADGNYPLSTGTPISATRVHLNLRPGCVSAIEVLETLVQVAPIEAALCMLPSNGEVPEIFEEFSEILGEDLPIQTASRANFYADARADHTALAIATGEQRRFANILLTLGVVRLPDACEAYAIEPKAATHANPTLRI